MEYLIVSINERIATAARFSINGRSMALVGAASFACEGDSGLAGVAAQIASGINGSPRVVLCLQPTLFAQRTVTLPLTDLRKIREIIPANLQGEIALPADEAVFDVLPGVDGAFLALWAKRLDIARAVETFREAGCEPQVVGSAVFGWQSLPGIPDDCAVCDGTALAILSGGRLSFVRAFDDGDIQRQLIATLSALELSGSKLPDCLIVFGEQAAALLAMRSLPLEVKQLQLSDELAPVFKNENTFLLLAGLYAVTRACHTGMLPDFRRGELAWTAGDATLRKKLILTAVLAVAATMLLFVSKGLQYQAVRADIASLNNSISAIYKEIFPSRTKAVDELNEVKGEIRKLSGIENSSSVLDTLKQLTEAKGSTINGLFDVELEGHTVRVKGDARSAQLVNEFKASLASVMSGIDLGEIKSRPDGMVSFSLAGTLKEAVK